MEVEYKYEALSLIETERAAETKLPVGVINSTRNKLVVIRAAPDERTLRNWKSLHYERFEKYGKGQRSIRINDQYRMVFEIDTQRKPNKITILRIEDTH